MIAISTPSALAGMESRKGMAPGGTQMWRLRELRFQFS
ncbi:hypothetical protein RB2654_14035 [Rhodobacterales bacterium HTCC2654]|uniref:Uncharacterized protein n=1 Tax=Maritimibacter alkaliphilus HTCC2654 TaxID=314271 RepID=A3VGK6_9RHOB|nr:hypothetical protein RB2654_14035 [Rhodobacterales bacterium HTCC2654] [Maritimibacter alkaliphilus HTCC2654]